MATLQFSTAINATKEKVWETLWNDATYRKWTSAFTEGSYAKSDWNEGSKVYFLDPDNNGMVSVIEKKIPNELMSFKHLGEVKNGEENTKDWGNSTESYSLSDKDGKTQVEVTLGMDSFGEFGAYLEKVFPKALSILKELSEN